MQQMQPGDLYHPMNGGMGGYADGQMGGGGWQMGGPGNEENKMNMDTHGDTNPIYMEGGPIPTHAQQPPQQVQQQQVMQQQQVLVNEGGEQPPTGNANVQGSVPISGFVGQGEGQGQGMVQGEAIEQGMIQVQEQGQEQ